MATLAMPRYIHIPRRKPADLRKRETILILDEEKDGEFGPFVPVWRASLPIRALKQLPPSGRYIPANRRFVLFLTVFGAFAGYIAVAGMLLAMWRIPILAFTVGFAPGVLLGALMGFVMGYAMRPRPLWVLRRYRNESAEPGAIRPIFEAYEPTPMHASLVEEGHSLTVIRASFMANVVKQIGVQRFFSVARPQQSKSQFTSLVMGAIAMAVIMVFALILSGDPKLTGTAPVQPPAVVENVQ